MTSVCGSCGIRRCAGMRGCIRPAGSWLVGWLVVGG